MDMGDFRSYPVSKLASVRPRGAVRSRLRGRESGRDGVLVGRFLMYRMAGYVYSTAFLMNGMQGTEGIEKRCPCYLTEGDVMAQTCLPKSR